jgi:hypothetical protein
VSPPKRVNRLSGVCAGWRHRGNHHNVRPFSARQCADHHFDDIVAGEIPNSPAPYLTAIITNVTGDGVNIALTVGPLSPESLTRMNSSLTGSYTLSDPTTVPDISLLSCSGNSPAGTGGIAPSHDGRCGGETSVAEPGTLGLPGLGLFGVAAGMRRRRKLH